MADVSLDQLKADIVEVGRRLYARGFVASNDGNITIRIAEDRLLTTPKSVSKGFMTPEMMVVVDLDGKKVAGHARRLVRAEDAPRGLPPARRRQGRGARASGAGDRLCRGRHPARSRRAGRSHLHARQHPHRRVRDAVDPGAAQRGAPVHQGARRPAAGQSRRADRRRRRLCRVLQDGDHRALREDQPDGSPARAANG